MAANTELTEQELAEVISSLKDTESEDEDEVPMQVVRGGAVKRPSQVRVVDTESLPIDEATRRRMAMDRSRKDDRLLKSMKGKTTDPRTLELVVEELAEEIFALKFERERLEDNGRDIANTAGRRVTAIKALIDTHLKLRELSKDDTIDFQSESMKIVLKLIFTHIKTSMEQAGYAKQDINNFFQVFQKNMESFETEAQRLIDQETRG